MDRPVCLNAGPSQTSDIGQLGLTIWVSRTGNHLSSLAQALFPIGRAAQGVALKAPEPSLAPLRPQDMSIVAIKQEALPASQGLIRLHLEMRLPCAVWGALNVTGPVSGWSLAEEPVEVRLASYRRPDVLEARGLPCKANLGAPCGSSD